MWKGDSIHQGGKVARWGLKILKLQVVSAYASSLPPFPPASFALIRFVPSLNVPAKPVTFLIFLYVYIQYTASVNNIH